MKSIGHYRKSMIYLFALAGIFTIAMVWACLDDSNSSVRSEAAGIDKSSSINKTPLSKKNLQGIVTHMRAPGQAAFTPISHEEIEASPITPMDATDNTDGAIAGTAPVISNALFNPATLDWESNCQLGDDDPGFTGYCTDLRFNICDVDSDLASGGSYGNLYVVDAVTHVISDLLPYGYPIFDEWDPMPDVSNCGNPPQLDLGIQIMEDLFTIPGAYDFLVDFYVQDIEGNFSNRLDNIPLTIYFYGSCSENQCALDDGAGGINCVADGWISNGGDGCEWCDISASRLVLQPRDGAPCNDGIFCNGSDHCSANQCTVHDDDPGCDAQCQTCNEGERRCDDKTNGEPCDDGFYCTGDDTCAGGTCNEHAGNPCSLLFCTNDCDEDTDTCVAGVSPPCPPDNGIWCDGLEICDEVNQQCSTTETCPVDDGLFCNGTETCDEINHICGHEGDPCDDEDWCTDDGICDEVNDSCPAKGETCPDDGLFCTGVEQCDEDGRECTATGDPCAAGNGQYCDGVEQCNEGTDSCESPNPIDCDNGLFCDGEEECDETDDQCITSPGTVPCVAGEICNEVDDVCEQPTDVPVLSDFVFNPDYLVWTPDCETTPCVQLEWYVCDPDDNLIGGQVFFYEPGTTDPANMLDQSVYTWEELIGPNPGPVNDCGNPFGPVSIDILLPASIFPDPGTYFGAVDIVASDAQGGLSNRLNAQGEMNVPTTTTTTVPATTTTTTSTIFSTEGPTMSDAQFNPSTVDWAPNCATELCTQLEWYVCDPDNDLEGGDLFFEDTNNFLVQSLQTIPWTSLITFPIDASDCLNPIMVIAPIFLEESLFGASADLYTASVNIESTDASGLPSNLLTGIELQVNYEPGSSTTTGQTTTSTTIVTTTTSTTSTTLDFNEPSILFNGSWNPNVLDWDPSCTSSFCTLLEFYVCDPQNNLEGGFVKILDYEGFVTQQPIEVPWADLINFPADVTDCVTPYGPVIWGLEMPESMFEIGTGAYIADVEISSTDSEGMWSNNLTGLGLTVNYVSTTTTTTTTVSTTTTTTTTDATTTTTQISTTTTTTMTGTEPPVISGGHFDPDVVDWIPECETGTCTNLKWFVCDPDNDLEGGEITFADALGLLLPEPIILPWDTFVEFPIDVSDCGNPMEISALIIIMESSFGTVSAEYFAEAEIQVTDGSTNQSNRLTGIDLTVNYEPGTTTTVTSSTTTTTAHAMAPVLSGGQFNPDTIDWIPDCENGTCTSLEWFVCDPQNDLEGGTVTLEDANLFILDEPFEMLWTDLISFPVDVTDCGNPMEVSVGVFIYEFMFGSASAEYYASAEIHSTDAAGHGSNRLTGIELTVNYDPGSTTTVTGSTTTTTFNPEAPVLSDSNVNPNLVDWIPDCENGTCAQLEWYVCDPDNDLEGGEVVIDDNNLLLLDEPLHLPWANLIDFPVDVSDCDTPFFVSAPIFILEEVFGTTLAQYVADLGVYATDNEGNESNKLEDNVLTINYGDDTTTTISTTTTTIPGDDDVDDDVNDDINDDVDDDIDDDTTDDDANDDAADDDGYPVDDDDADPISYPRAEEDDSSSCCG